MSTSEKVVITPDGTALEYTISGEGPGVLMIHGSQYYSEPTKSMVDTLQKKFTLYSMDRRGWGHSGAKGSDYSIKKECEDAIELITKHNIPYVFGIDYGAVIALHIALRYQVQKIVVFEPYLTSLRNLNWISKLNDQVERNDYFSAMVTYTKGTNYRTKHTPRFLLKKAFKHFAVDKDKQIINKLIECEDLEIQKKLKKDIESEEWKLNKQMLRTISSEIEAAKQAEAGLSNLETATTDFLIICDKDSEPFMCDSAEKLSSIIPRNQYIVVDLYNSDNKKIALSEPPKFFKSVTQFLIGE